MRIGIDARFLTHPQRGGFKTYTQNLINAISRVDDINQYFIYVDRSFEPDTLPSRNNFTCRVIEGTTPLIGMMFREQVLLPRIVSIDKVDLLHSLCNTAPIFLYTKRVVTLHDTIQIEASGKLGHISNIKAWGITAYSKWSIIRSLHKSNYVITVSDYEKKRIVGLLDFPTKHVAVTHLAPNSIYRSASPIEKDEFRVALLNKFKIRSDFILSVGFEDRKNIPLVVQAYERLSSDFPGLNLVIVSADENKRMFFQELVKSYRIDDRVIVLGSVVPSDLLKLYNIAKVFVFPSERESFGLPPLEAMSCGTPTIAMNSSSIPEILGDDATLINSKDAQIWADAIRDVLLNEKKRSEMTKRGLKRAAQFSWDNCARETINIYKSVIENYHVTEG
jgi:glycosyltransferase involved in cell wall biosynthesis